jgi:hypothetical protein
MLFFTRVATFKGSPRRVVPWATEVTRYVNSHIDLDVSLWSATFGFPVGTYAWSTAVESQVALVDATAKLATDDAYFDLLEQTQDLLVGPPVDMLDRLVAGEPQDGGEPPGVGAVVAVTTAIAIADRLGDAVGWAIDIGSHATEVTGTPVMVTTSVMGQMGEISWIAIHPDVASAEASWDKFAADAGYLPRISGSKDLFVPGSSRIMQLVKIA